MTNDASDAAEPLPSGDQVVRDLLVRCEARLLARIRWMMGDSVRKIAETADFHGELVQKVLSSAGQLSWRDEAHFLRLATRIARHLLIDHARRPRVQRFDSISVTFRGSEVTDPVDTSPASALAREEAIERMMAALESMPSDFQRVVEMRHFDALSFREIGERMQRSENAAQLLHARALKMLGEQLGG